MNFLMTRRWSCFAHFVGIPERDIFKARKGARTKGTRPFNLGGCPSTFPPIDDPSGKENESSLPFYGGSDDIEAPPDIDNDIGSLLPAVDRDPSRSSSDEFNEIFHQNPYFNPCMNFGVSESDRLFSDID
ncbi:hypothetical protein M422DRAFT_47262 [Sphaerobolus stellatus SS14]|uniref:Uncharacterized protein n=1 Tax=Sphaerobolus stellatus (strain SS14) TaxID=990650 RepID=A0A0C9VZH6_SPHS4|nr:hypothetical protein M422DRAFT_47262 [Sphaerobolus stellatus SS14]